MSIRGTVGMLIVKTGNISIQDVFEILTVKTGDMSTYLVVGTLTVKELIRTVHTISRARHILA